MALKKLSQFLHFDFAEFSKGKVFKLTGVGPWSDYNTKEHLGTKYEVSIAKDDTEYKQKDGEQVSNLYEKLNFKVAKPAVNIPLGSLVKPVNPVATIYGPYRNQLSVKADDIQVISQLNAQQGGK